MPSIHKRVLLFASKLGYQTRAFNSVAERLGVELVFVTDRCHRLEDPWQDLAIPARFENPEAAAASVIDSQRNLQVDGILALGDRATLTAAHVARQLAIPFHHPLSVGACRNKLRMREVFRDAGLPVPQFRAVPIDPLPDPSLLRISYPCVLKPLSLSASQGVARANNRDEFFRAAGRLKHLLESPEIRASREPRLDRILVEDYLPGREVATEGLITDGELRILAIFDKPDPLEGPFFEETIYITPSRLPVDVQRSIESSFRNAAAALGLTNGPVHGEFRVNDTGIWTIEIAPRPIGGMCAQALRFQLSGKQLTIGLEELLLRHSLRMPGTEASREPEASGVMMIPVPRSGTYERLDGLEAAREIPLITGIQITARVHDYIVAWPEGSSYLGFIFASGANPVEVEAAIRAAHAKLHFSLVPRLPVEHPVTGTL
ncbi:MAG: ATP-grasp domain-containing protein [Candidatus Acidiferrum sp.]